MSKLEHASKSPKTAWHERSAKISIPEHTMRANEAGTYNILTSSQVMLMLLGLDGLLYLLILAKAGAL